MVNRAQAEQVVSQVCVLKTVHARLSVLQAPNVLLLQPPVQRTTFSASEDSAKPQVAKAALAQKDVNLEFALDQVREVLVLTASLHLRHFALLIRLDVIVFLAYALRSPKRQ